MGLITTVQGGMIVTGSVGTGLVVRKKSDGSWSAPCAVGTFGLGVGATFGLQSTDMIIVIHSEAALHTFMSGGSLSLGAEVGLSIGPFGRTAAAEFRANEKGVASTSSYSQSKVRWRVFFCFCRDAVQLLGLCSSQPSPFPQTGVLWRSAGRQFGFESPA